MNKKAPTRGYGVLESFLARRRALIADSAINPNLRSGKILDVGCGSFPFFLHNTIFAEKFGIDTNVENFLDKEKKITVFKHNFINNDELPFDSNIFDVVTMLAVWEHIPEKALGKLVSEIYRVLKPNTGVLVLTSPAPVAAPILCCLSMVGLVSRIEICEHQPLSGAKKIKTMLRNAGFNKNNLSHRYFQFFVNQIVIAKK